jgi:Tfp pilus assembly protein PilF
MSEIPSSERRKRKRPLPVVIWDWYHSLASWTQIAIAVVILSVPGALLSYKFLKPIYHDWVARNSLKLAASAVEKKDYQTASLAFRKAVMSAPKNPEVWEKVVEYLELADSPESVAVWSRLTKLRPDDVEYQFKLAESAVKYRRVYDAQRALAGFSDETKQSARYLKVASGFAALRGDSASARDSLSRLVAMDPGDREAYVNLLAANLRVDDPAAQKDAVKKLEALADESGDFSTRALRDLAGYAASKNDAYAANIYAQRLVDRPDATVKDRLFHLNTEIITKSFTLPITVDKITDYAESHPEDLPAVANFLVTQGKMSEIRDWIEKLPPETKALPAIQSLQIDLALRDGDVDEAFAMLKSGKTTSELDPALLDLAEQAITQYVDGRADAEQAWKKAILQVQSQPQPLQVLAALARSSGWVAGLAEAMWALTNVASGQVTIWADLTKLELSRNNAPGALRALSGALQVDPYDPQLRNDWAFLAILLNTVSAKDVLETTRQNLDADPSNPYFQTTHALALFTSGDQKEALATIDKLAESQRQMPERALVVGLILAQTERKAEALRYLDRIADKAPTFLPEQQRLYLQAVAAARGEGLASEELKRATSRHEMSDEERATFNEALRVQRETASSAEAREALKKELAQRAQERSAVRSGEESITEQLRAESQARQRTPEELKELMKSIRGELSEPAKGEETP